jgi:hypothetical protein
MHPVDGPMVESKAKADPVDCVDDATASDLDLGYVVDYVFDFVAYASDPVEAHVYLLFKQQLFKPLIMFLILILIQHHQ